MRLRAAGFRHAALRRMGPRHKDHSAPNGQSSCVICLTQLLNRRVRAWNEQSNVAYGFRDGRDGKSKGRVTRREVKRLRIYIVISLRLSISPFLCRSSSPSRCYSKLLFRLPLLFGVTSFFTWFCESFFNNSRRLASSRAAFSVRAAPDCATPI